MVALTRNTSFSFPFDQSLLGLPLAELAQLSAEEGQKYTLFKPNEPSVILALFYRAFARGADADAAWTALYEQFFSLVLRWMCRSRPSTFSLLLQQESAPSLVNAAFEKFARSISPEKIQHFTNLAQLLSYFQLCTRGVLADRVQVFLSPKYQELSNALSWEDLRACEHRHDALSWEDFHAWEHRHDAPRSLRTEDVIALVLDQCFAEHFWTVVNACLHDDRERLLLHLIFQKQMRPKEICGDYPTLYATTSDIDLLKRTILGRLARSPKLRQFLVEYDALPQRLQGKEGYKEAS